MATAEKPAQKLTLPGHMELPSENGEFVKNFREHPQSLLLTDSILPVLRALHPEGDFAIGQDCGIYWREADPPQRGAICPDWFYVPGVPPTIEGHFRRSYVLWKEVIPPRLILEFASDDGREERDATPYEGKFWVYENAIRPVYYGIFVVETGDFEFYRLDGARYRRVAPDERGHFPVEDLGVALGIWEGFYLNEVAPWLRWWDRDGHLLPTGDELAAQERHRANEEARRADEEARRADEEARLARAEAERAQEATRRADALAAKLRAVGIDPDAVAPGGGSA